MDVAVENSMPCSGPPTAAPPVKPRSNRAPAVAILLLGAFLPPLDFCIVNLALPAIRDGLQATGSQLQLVMSCYASAYAVFLITGGRLGDLFGRKGITAASLHAGFGPGIPFHVGLICAGVGRGLLQPSTVRIVLAEVAPEQAGLAVGVVTSVLQIGAAVGVAAVGSVFFTVLGRETTPGAYGNAFASSLAIAAGLQVVGMTLAAKLNHRHRRQGSHWRPAASP